MDLRDVSLSIKTFLRDEALYATIKAVRKNLPEVQMIITDDGEMTEEKDGIYADLHRDGHLCFTLPFDSGFGIKSNTAATAVTRKYLLTGSDDFDFNPPEVRQGIERLVWNIENRIHQDLPLFDIVSGRVNNRPYEFFLSESDGVVREIPCNYDGIKPILSAVHCDLTVNYSLIRKEVFQKVLWDDDAKIGQGEHGSFFIDVKRAGFRVGFVPNVSISEQQIENSDRYRQFRNRARSPERSCFKKRGIRQYVLGDKTVDYNECVSS